MEIGDFLLFVNKVLEAVFLFWKVCGMPDANGDFSVEKTVI